MNRFRRFACFSLVLAPLAASLIGCSKPAATDPVASAPAASPGIAKPVKPNADAVEAVTVGNAEAPVKLAFELSGRPVVGQPLQVRIVLTATADADEIQTSLDVPDGMQLTDDSVYFQVAKAVAGQRYEHSFGLKPTAPGVTLLTATVTADIGDTSVASQFEMPVIAVAAASAAAAAKAPAAR